MELQHLRQFTETYLQANQCQILESSPSHLVTQLSIPVDKDLLNRPFYWMYVEKMNLDPQPARLCLVFDPENWDGEMRGEHFFYGCPRFTKMLQSAQKQGQFVRLYQEPETTSYFRSGTHAYYPWLGINFFVSYVCDRKKDTLHYLGMNLQNGTICENFYQQLCNQNWISKLPPHHYTVSPYITIAEAVSEMEYYLQEQLEQDDFTWADEAMQRLQQEKEQLETYYEKEKDSEEKKQRMQELIWQYHPRIEIRVVNAGIFYRLTNET